MLNPEQSKTSILQSPEMFKLHRNLLNMSNYYLPLTFLYSGSYFVLGMGREKGENFCELSLIVFPTFYRSISQR